MIEALLDAIRRPASNPEPSTPGYVLPEELVTVRGWPLFGLTFASELLGPPQTIGRQRGWRVARIDDVEIAMLSVDAGRGTIAEWTGGWGDPDGRYLLAQVRRCLRPALHVV